MLSRGFSNLRDLRFFVDSFELLIISLHNRNIGIREHSESIKDICQVVIDALNKENIDRYNPYWVMPKFFDLLSISSASQKTGEEYRPLLFKFIKIYSAYYTEIIRRIFSP